MSGAPSGSWRGLVLQRIARRERLSRVANLVNGGLADLLRERTRDLHVQAERSGILGDILHGRAGVESYALLLRNLLPAYQGIEAGLERHRDSAAVGALAVRAVYRSAAIESDLRAICGAEAVRGLPLLDAGRAYARRVDEAAGSDGSRLIAHAYTRFLGDLNGGQILRRLLSKSLGLGPDATRFYTYPDATDVVTLRDAYRRALDTAGEAAQPEVIVEEALAAFQLNIDVSEQVREATCVRTESTPRS